MFQGPHAGPFSQMVAHPHHRSGMAPGSWRKCTPMRLGSTNTSVRVALDFWAFPGSHPMCHPGLEPGSHSCRRGGPLRYRLVELVVRSASRSYNPHVIPSTGSGQALVQRLSSNVILERSDRIHLQQHHSTIQASHIQFPVNS